MLSCERVAFRIRWDVELVCVLLVCVDYQERYSSGMTLQAVGIGVNILRRRNVRIEDRAAHEFPLEKRCPVVRTRLEGFLVEQSVVADGKRVVHDDLHAHLREPSMLDEVAEGIEESGCPGIAAACGV